MGYAILIKNSLYTYAMSNPASEKDRIEQLRKLINYHNYRYYMLDSPELAMPNMMS